MWMPRSIEVVEDLLEKRRLVVQPNPALNFAAASVMSGMEDCVIAGGTEMMSYTSALGAEEANAGLKPLGMGSGNRALDELHPQSHQGVCGDAIATMEGFTREELDEVAEAAEGADRAVSRVGRRGAKAADEADLARPRRDRGDDLQRPRGDLGARRGLRGLALVRDRARPSDRRSRRRRYNSKLYNKPSCIKTNIFCRTKNE